MTLQRELKYEIIENILIIKFIGEINFFYHDDFEEIIKTKSENCKHLIVDMIEVTYINSSGLGILFKIAQLFDVRIVGPRSKFVVSVLEILQAGNIIGIFNSLDEAVRDIQEKQK